MVGYLGYDLKNDLFQHQSTHSDPLQMPEAAFFEPIIWVEYQNAALKIQSAVKKNVDDFVERYHAVKNESINGEEVQLIAEISKNTYLKNAEIIKNHIKSGRIKGVNYCLPFTGMAKNFNAVQRFIELQKRTMAPFSVFAKLNELYILSASPERYLKNSNGNLISQPIKGTTKRSTQPQRDLLLLQNLQNNVKERAENTMTASLVQSELEKISLPHTTRVDKLCEVQSFKTVHHLVSTVSSQLNTEKYNHWDAVKATLPMGSMTGVPKEEAIKIIDACESFKRGAYSGAFGWMDKSGDFDFNVLIRTLIYNAQTQKISLAVGSAITIDSNPEAEYRECMLKAQAILESLKVKSHEVY